MLKYDNVPKSQITISISGVRRKIDSHGGGMVGGIGEDWRGLESVELVPRNIWTAPYVRILKYIHDFTACTK